MFRTIKVCLLRWRFSLEFHLWQAFIILIGMVVQAKRCAVCCVTEGGPKLIAHCPFQMVRFVLELINEPKEGPSFLQFFLFYFNLFQRERKTTVTLTWYVGFPLRICNSLLCSSAPLLLCSSAPLIRWRGVVLTVRNFVEGSWLLAWTLHRYVLPSARSITMNWMCASRSCATSQYHDYLGGTWHIEIFRKKCNCWVKAAKMVRSWLNRASSATSSPTSLQLCSNTLCAWIHWNPSSRFVFVLLLPTIT